MKKGQKSEDKLKNTLKFFKMNESAISTAMGGVVVLVIAGLIFNYFRTTNLKTWQGLLNGEGAQTSEEAPKDEKTRDTYKVVKGDDLWHIAEKYYKSGYNYVDIIKENNLPANGAIEVGMELKIPKVEAKAATVNGETKIAKQVTDKVSIEKKEDQKIEEAGAYTIVKGDSYWKIAVKEYGDGYAWTKIYQANKKLFPNPNIIHSGAKIVIPSSK